MEGKWQQQQGENILLKTWFLNMDKEFDEKLRSKRFISLLDTFINSNLNIFNNINYTDGYLNSQLIYHNFFDLYLKYFYSPFISYTKEFNLAEYEIIFQKDNVKLLHYINKYQKCTETRGSKNKNILLIIYAPINRFHILDLNTSKSVVRNLLANDIDVYLLDWGYPESKDDDLTLKDYIVYMEEAIQTIIKTHSSFSLQSSSSSSSPSSTTEFSQIKISILGYCWGGLFSLIYSAINRHQTNINKLILMATPIDFNKDNTTVSMWSKSIDNNNKIIKTFGHFDGYLLDFVFNIRNPAKFLFGKYFNLWKHLDNKDFVNTFFDVEKWLHDTPPIPGKLYNKIINDCYRNNLLITENMRLEDNQTILGKGNGEENNNLIKINRITIPILSIIAENDTLVSPMSSLAINDHVASQEKKVIKHDGGYVSLCISENAHKEVWPRVASWIKS